jgi:poly(3-hydroxybutyrate) depolymerase
MLFGLVALIGACAGDDVVDDATETDDTEVAEPAFTGADLAPLSDGPCPDMGSGGTKTFASSGSDRSFELILPEAFAPGMPALVVWHGLGDSASSMARWMALQRFADDRGMVVVLPDSPDRNGMTWDLTLSGNQDLVLYDDLRTCMAQELEIDLARLHVTGFSYGGLMSTAVTMARSDTLASAFIMSGGTAPFFVPYASPSHKLPVMIMWGGEGDTYGEGMTQVRFEETSLDLSQNLRSDGHVVAHCDHGQGHEVPFGIHDLLDTWFVAHQFGAPSPLSEDLGDVPEWCTIP